MPYCSGPDLRRLCGDVIIHGEMGYPPGQETDAAAAVDKDQVSIFDDTTAAPGDFTINLHGSDSRT